MEEALKIKDEGQYGNAIESLESLKETRTLFKTKETQGTQFCKELDSVIRGMDALITDYENRTASAEVKRVKTLATTDRD